MNWIGILIGVLLVVIIIQAVHIYELRSTFRLVIKNLGRLKAMLEGYYFARKESEEENI